MQDNQIPTDAKSEQITPAAAPGAERPITLNALKNAAMRIAYAYQRDRDEGAEELRKVLDAARSPQDRKIGTIAFNTGGLSKVTHWQPLPAPPQRKEIANAE